MKNAAGYHPRPVMPSTSGGAPCWHGKIMVTVRVELTRYQLESP